MARPGVVADGAALSTKRKTFLADFPVADQVCGGFSVFGLYVLWRQGLTEAKGAERNAPGECEQPKEILYFKNAKKKAEKT